MHRKEGQKVSNSCKRYPDARFHASLPRYHPVKVHDSLKWAAFQAKYAVNKMCPGKPRTGRALKAEKLEKRFAQKTALRPEALQTLKVLTNEVEMESIKQEMSIKVEGDDDIIELE